MFLALLYGSQLANHPRHIGCIDPKCNVLEVVKGKNPLVLCHLFVIVSFFTLISFYILDPKYNV